MKSKYSFMWRVVIALVLACSLGLVMAAPAAATVSTVTVTVDPVNAGETAEYTIAFTTTQDLADPDEIRVEFPNGTTVPATYTATDITVNGDAVKSASGADQLVTLVVDVDVPAGAVTVVFTTDADIVNPTAGDYTLDVSTSEEVTPVTSSAYTISLPAPTVTIVAPPKANQEETLDIVITGTNFGEDATVSFGSGISVVVTVDSETQITATIIIAATATVGTRDVSVTTATGSDTKVGGFTVQADGTELVDIYDASGVYKSSEASITLAIADADAVTGGTLIAHAATYSETVTVTKSLTIESYMGAASTIIDGSGGIFGVTLAGTDQTIEDLTINRGGSVGGVGAVQLYSVGDNFTIKDCTFSDWGRTGDQHATGKNDAVICAGGAGPTWAGAFTTQITGGLIEGNTFTGNSRTAIWLQTSGSGILDDLTIKDNDLLGCLQTSDGHGIRLQGEIGQDTAGLAAVDNNTISDMSGTAIILRIEEGSTDTGEATITDNNISGCYQGIDATAAWVLTISENTIENNRENGIKIGDGTQGSFTIEYNDISGNAVYGLLNEDAAEPITAKYNWWGKIGGPSAGTGTYKSTALGNGDAVSKLVTYDPWLTVVQATAVDDGIAYHGSTMPLEEGWNTLSVPLALSDSADTLDDIAALGDFLVTSGADRNYDGGFYYDGTLWQPIITSTYEFQPGAAVYVKMLADASFPVLYSGVFSLPSLSLSAGWNLVGSAFGIDKVAGSSGISVGDYGVCSLDPAGTDTYGDLENDATDADIESWKAVNAALASLGDDASVVISPSMPGQEAVWAITVLTTEEMIVGEGYWVFMTSSATLAGFEVTPIYKIFLP